MSLLDELRHRGKNDLQLIQAMLVMQKRGQADAQVRRGFDDVMNRIAAIGVAHDQLTPSRGAGRVQLADYLRALCGNLATRRNNIGIETHLASIDIPHEQAVPVGLIVNELVTNALKYAFPDDLGGAIQVGLETLVEGEAVLTVRDDGIGMGPPRSGSSGTGLVQRLVQQLGGQLDREERERGTGFAITFPVVT